MSNLRKLRNELFEVASSKDINEFMDEMFECYLDNVGLSESNLSNKHFMKRKITDIILETYKTARS